jgi:glycosyltransferase involved in cell wall biosynthesis
LEDKISSEKIASLFVIYFGSNVGYAIAPLETLFYEEGLRLSQGDTSMVHFAYRDLKNGQPQTLPAEFKNCIVYDILDSSNKNIASLLDYVRSKEIRLVVFFDINPVLPLYRKIRLAGARVLLSYYGAPVSSVMPWWKLVIKKSLFFLSRSRLDGLIFESQAMADLAVRGRGVPKRLIDIVPLGVDIKRFKPGWTDYAYRIFNIPLSEKIVIYAGHMERRKGVHTLIEAAIQLLKNRHRSDVSFIICGNKGKESKDLEALYAGLGFDSKIRFGGYRSDMRELYASCLCGVIPSTGWDSFPRTSIEMAAAGLPVIASRLHGLCEAVVDGETGLLFEPGNAHALADLLEKVLDQPEYARKLGQAGRLRCEHELNLEVQASRFHDVIKKRLFRTIHESNG